MFCDLWLCKHLKPKLSTWEFTRYGQCSESSVVDWTHNTYALYWKRQSRLYLLRSLRYSGRQQ